MRAACLKNSCSCANCKSRKREVRKTRIETIKRNSKTMFDDVPREPPLRLCDRVGHESARRSICGADWDKKEDAMASGSGTSGSKRYRIWSCNQPLSYRRWPSRRRIFYSAVFRFLLRHPCLSWNNTQYLDGGLFSFIEIPSNSLLPPLLLLEFQFVNFILKKKLYIENNSVYFILQM